MWKRLKQWMRTETVYNAEHVDPSKLLGYTGLVTDPRIQENVRNILIANVKSSKALSSVNLTGLAALSEQIMAAIVGWEESILDVETAIRDDRSVEGWRDLRSTRVKETLTRLNSSYFLVRNIDLLLEATKPISGSNGWELWLVLGQLWKQVCIYQRENHIFLDWHYSELQMQTIVCAYTLRVKVPETTTCT